MPTLSPGHPVRTLTRPTVAIAVGNELIDGYTTDENAAWLAARCRELGWPIRRVEIVADDPEDIVAAVRRGVDDGSVRRLIVCGGLGPTPDDVTAAAVASALGRALVEDPVARAYVEAVVGRAHAAGRVPSPVPTEPNRKMFRVPQGARVLGNPVGMAPGLAMEMSPNGDRFLLLLPGVPHELRAIFDTLLAADFFGGGAAGAVVEVVYGAVPEAELAGPMTVLAAEFPDVHVGSYPQREPRRLLLRLQGDDQRVARAAARLRQLRPVD